MGALLMGGAQDARGQSLNADALIDLQNTLSEAVTQNFSDGRSDLQPCPPGQFCARGDVFSGSLVEGFQFSAAAPVVFNSNPTASAITPRSGVEGDPEFRLNWAHSIGRVSFLANFKSDLDRYSNNRSRGTDKLTAGLSATVKFSETLSSKIAYAHQISYLGTFSSRKQKLNEFTASVTKNTSFGAGGKFSLAISAGRREIDPLPSSYSLSITPTIKYPLTESWLVKVSAGVTRRIYDSLGGFARRDWLEAPTVALAWNPTNKVFGGAKDKWIAAGAPEIAFQLSMARQQSNKVTGSFKRWSIGPAISADWRF